MLCPQLAGESSDLYVTSAEIDHHTLDTSGGKRSLTLIDCTGLLTQYAHKQLDRAQRNGTERNYGSRDAFLKVKRSRCVFKSAVRIHETIE